MYEYRDEYNKVYHLNARIGGFTKESAAIAAIARRSKVGYVTDDQSRILFVVRKGVKI
jgi:hypothetical protein